MLKLIFALLLSSCTHWLIETETRIQMENGTSGEIHDLSLISSNGQIMVWIPETVEPGKRSRVYGKEWVGEFNFAVYSGDSLIDLGVHRLEGGTVLAQIKEEKGKFAMRFK